MKGDLMMKKFAAILLALLLIVAMTAVSFSAVSTVSFGSGTGTLNVYKNIPSPGTDTSNALEGAGFTAYKVMTFEGTAPNQYFSFTEPYASDAAVQSYAAANLTPVNSETNKYVTYGDTDDLEGIISTPLPLKRPLTKTVMLNLPTSTRAFISSKRRLFPMAIPLLPSPSLLRSLMTIR